MKDFIEYLENNPYRGNQESCGTGKNYWTADMWTLEVAKAYCYGNYKKPKKFENNRHCDPSRIIEDAQIKVKEKKILESIKNDADYLLIGEVGRGLDVLIANSVKKWKKIYCFDHVNYKHYLMFDNVEFFHTSTGAFCPCMIRERCIFIMNHSIHSYDKFKRYMRSVHGLINGEMIW